jgi:1,2-diacylglycerol 3-alpha-glucosyltransferase
MNVGIFTDTYTPHINGVVRSIDTLKTNLEKHGHTVYVVTIDFAKEYRDADRMSIRLPGIPFLPEPMFKIGTPYSFKAMKILHTLNLDIIHSHTEWSIGLFAKIVSRRLDIPLIHTFHTMYVDYAHYINKGSLQPYVEGMIKKFVKIHCNSAHTVIAPSLKAKEALVSYGINKKIEVLPTGINLERFETRLAEGDTAALRTSLGFKADDFVVLYLGRLAEEKNIPAILKGLADTKHPSIKMLVVGDGPKRKELETLSQELGLAEKVRFAGAQPMDRVPLFYHTADLFVSASDTETQGLTIFEAMASRVPVLVKHDTNVSDLFEDMVDCLYFYDDTEIGRKIEDLSHQKEFLQSLTSHAGGKIADYSEEVFIDSMLQIYDNNCREGQLEPSLETDYSLEAI